MDQHDGNSPPLGHVRSLFGDWAAPIIDASITTDVSKDLAESFDAVMCMAVLHVLSREQSMHMLTRLCEVLRASGYADNHDHFLQ